MVDWYNPITCHQDDFYRHPARDKTHGRIWRVSPKAGVIVPPNLLEAPLDELMAALRSPERWTRLKAKQVLAGRERRVVAEEIGRWSAGQSGRDLLESLAVLEWIGQPDASVAGRALASPDHRTRAYAARVVGRWAGLLDDSHDMLVRAARDPHPLVRMEAVLACGQIPEARSILIAAAAAELPRDRWIDYAFAQAVHHLRGHWLPALRRGELDFAGMRRGLAAVLGAGGEKGVLEDMRTLYASEEVRGAARIALANALVAVGEEEDVQLLLRGDFGDGAVLRALRARERPARVDVMPALGRALLHPSAAVRLAATELAAHWRVKELYERILKVAFDGDADLEWREAAIRALGPLGNEKTVDVLRKVAGLPHDPEPAAVAAMLDLNPAVAASLGGELLRLATEEETIRGVFGDFARHEGALVLLGAELGKAAPGKEQAERLRRAWIATGIVDTGLSGILNGLAGADSELIPFSEEAVAEFVGAARGGDVMAGKVLFEGARGGCFACHRVGKTGGTLGPDLSAVGSGMLPDRIVTEVLWPRRQAKEGYSLTRVTTVEGEVLQGYVQASREKGALLLRGFSDGRLHEIPVDHVSRREEIGSFMPPTAQGFSKEELAHLLAYLFSLDGSD